MAYKQSASEILAELKEHLAYEFDWESYSKSIIADYGQDADVTAIWENKTENLIADYANALSVNRDEALRLARENER